ncbi:MAG: OmpA family protein [Candidatus Desulfofervidaceae bacterium]|nr:OmpA family protein [Candidatus Desulfofervidaceae bacterium]
MAKPDPYGWMLTYSDMVTLLLTFFVLLISLSSFDEQKFKTFSTSVGNALISGEGIGILKEGSTGKIELISRRRVMEELRRGVPKEILVGLTKDLEVISRKDGWTLRLPADLLFAPNSTTISPAAQPILDKIALLINKMLVDVEIAGHADKTEMNKWELSGRRAAAVLHYLVDKGGVNEGKLVIMAYGDARLLSATDRAKNRRVEIIIKKKKFILGS